MQNKIFNSGFCRYHEMNFLTTIFKHFIDTNMLMQQNPDCVYNIKMYLNNNNE